MTLLCRGRVAKRSFPSNWGSKYASVSIRDRVPLQSLCFCDLTKPLSESCEAQIFHIIARYERLLIISELLISEQFLAVREETHQFEIYLNNCDIQAKVMRSKERRKGQHVQAILRYCERENNLVDKNTI